VQRKRPEQGGKEALMPICPRRERRNLSSVLKERGPRKNFLHRECITLVANWENWGEEEKLKTRSSAVYPQEKPTPRSKA